MKISDILKESHKAYPSLEIVPPLKGMSREDLLESIRPFMDFDPKYINVTCHRDEYEYVPNADGTYTKRVVQNRISEVAVCAAIMSKYHIEAVPHIICAGATIEQINQELDNLYYMGIDNCLALRGDCLTNEKRFTPTPGGYAYASELVEGIRNYRREETGRHFSIGVGGYPEKHFEAPNIETDILNLKKKVDAGADYVITQMFFDNEVFYDFERRCREAGINVPVIPGLKPISTARQVHMLPESFSLDIPVELSSAIESAAHDKEAVYEIGTKWCKEQCKDLLRHGVPAIHFYTMGKTRNICEILKDCF
ncbi:MAG: methylenetetrahydrofolate reductase [NAD(P)H] [Bacteroidales bacterium]|nr:methylenetetrahydrofolate reductase [NAD(P)H] [Candidatus Cryptobacteroides caccocaballi]